MDASSGYQLRHQRQAWNANAAAEVTKNPVCKQRSLSTPPLSGAYAACQCQGPMIQGQLPQENIWWWAPGCCNVTAASTTTGLPHILYLSLPTAWVSQGPLISCSFNPLLSGWRTDTRGRPTYRGGAKTKVEHHELCKQRRERKISLYSLRSSGLDLDNQLDVPCICGKL